MDLNFEQKIKAVTYWLNEEFTFFMQPKMSSFAEGYFNLAIWIRVLERDENEVTALNALKDLDF